MSEYTIPEGECNTEQVDTRRGFIQEVRQSGQAIPRKPPARGEVLTLNDAVFKKLNNPRLEKFISECVMQLKPAWNRRSLRHLTPLKKAPHPEEPGRQYDYTTLPYDVAMDLMDRWFPRALQVVKARLEQEILEREEAVRTIVDTLERMTVSPCISDEDSDERTDEEITNILNELGYE